jgi:hypothetical protein
VPTWGATGAHNIYVGVTRRSICSADMGSGGWRACLPPIRIAQGPSSVRMSDDPNGPNPRKWWTWRRFRASGQDRDVGLRARRYRNMPGETDPKRNAEVELSSREVGALARCGQPTVRAPLNPTAPCDYRKREERAPTLGEGEGVCGVTADSLVGVAAGWLRRREGPAMPGSLASGRRAGPHDGI